MRYGLGNDQETKKDEELMLQFQQGDEACFRALVDRYKQRIYAFTYRFLNRSPEAEDIAQEVFVKVYFSRDTYRPTAKFSTWVYVISKNACLQALKKVGSNISINERRSNTDLEMIETIAGSGDDNPSEKLLNEEKSGQIAAAISRLPESQKMAILLKRYDQMSYEEIAEVMNCSVQSVKSLLFRGRSTLKEYLKEYFRED
jgi:RNA polymerase sigma-70 factor (ECF subfamily)